MRFSAAVLLLPIASVAIASSALAFAPPQTTALASAARGLRYVRHADDMGWPEQKYAGREVGDYEDQVNARFSRHRRRERLRRRRAADRDVATSYSHGAEMERQRDELLRLEDVRTARPHGRREGTRTGRATGPRRPRLLANTPVPIVNFRVNSDFPASELPASRWHAVARPPPPFEEAAYSHCARSAGVRALVPAENPLADELEDGLAVVFDGADYVVGTLGDVIIPEGRSGLAYWLRDKIYDAIYGQVRRGTVLHRLSSPVQVRLPPWTDSSSTPTSSSAGEWTLVEYAVLAFADETVAIKEMGWDHIERQRLELAEDPIKEVAAMQHLQRFVEDERVREADMRMLNAALRGGEEEEVIAESAMERSRIVLPTDLLSDEHNLYSITPFCDGGRLLEVLESKGRFSEPEARYWMRQILEGLSCLKRAGVCHRDISPENLMVHRGNVYIIDLGMCLRIPEMVDHADNGSHAKRRQRHQQRSLILPQSACGKWYYLSPEVCESEGPFDGPAVDLWAASVILFTMLTGLPPWEAPETTDENFKLMSTGYLAQMLTERRAGLSADALDLLQRMFWRDPADRLSLEQVRSHPWMAHGDVLPFSNEQ